MLKKLALLPVFVFAIVTLEASPALAVLNHAAAFGWQGYADTDLEFAEFYPGDHTLMVRFMIVHRQNI